MKKLRLEFICSQKIPRAGVMVVVLSFSAALMQTLALARISESSQTLQSHYVELQGEITTKQRSLTSIKQSANLATDSQKKGNSKIINSLNYPWNRMLLPIELSLTDDVALLSYTHSQSSKQTQLSIVAKDVAALIRFVENLNEGNGKEKWYVASYQTDFHDNASNVKGRIVSYHRIGE